MKTYPHLWGRLYGQPLMVHPDKAATIERVFQMHLLGAVSTNGLRLGQMEDDHEPDPVAEAERRHQNRMAAYSGIDLQRRDDKPYALTKSGVALIPVMGTLVQRTSGMDAWSGMQSYGDIAQVLGRAMADSDVRAVLMEIDSPGGETAGLFDLAATITAGRQQKPLWSFANEQAFSAAYAIACSAEKFFLPRTGLTGSVGTIALHVDQSKRDASQGYIYTAVYAGARKNDFSSHQPLSDPALAALKNLVNSANDIFVATVAANRKMSEEAVRATEAGIFTAPEAVKVGFADGVATLAETVTALEQVVDTFSSGTRLAVGLSTTSKEISMTTPASTAASALAPQTEAAAASIDVTKVSADAATAERTRIAAILGCDEAKGRTKLAQHLAMETTTDVEAARKLLSNAAQEGSAPANPLAVAMSQVPNPAVGAAGAVAGGEEDAESMAARIASYGQPRKLAAVVS